MGDQYPPTAADYAMAAAQDAQKKAADNEKRLQRLEEYERGSREGAKAYGVTADEVDTLCRLVDQADLIAAWVNVIIARWDSGQGVSFSNSDKNLLVQLITTVNESRAILSRHR